MTSSPVDTSDLTSSDDPKVSEAAISLLRAALIGMAWELESCHPGILHVVTRRLIDDLEEEIVLMKGRYGPGSGRWLRKARDVVRASLRRAEAENSTEPMH